VTLHSPIKPPIKKQTICAIIRSITNTESFLPLRFSIIVPCILFVLTCYPVSPLSRLSLSCDFVRGNRHPPTPRYTPSEITRDASDNRLAFANRSRRSSSKWKPVMGNLRHSRNFEFRDISSSRVYPASSTTFRSLGTARRSSCSILVYSERKTELLEKKAF